MRLAHVEATHNATVEPTRSDAVRLPRDAVIIGLANAGFDAQGSVDPTVEPRGLSGGAEHLLEPALNTVGTMTRVR